MWVTFNWKDALDIMIVAVLFYAFLLLLRRAHSRFLVNGISMLLVLYAMARFLNLYLTSILFQAVFAFFAVMLAVIFQRELRSFFEWLSIWGRLSRAQQESPPDRVADQIIDALTQLAKRKIGALIVFPGQQGIDALVQGGVALDGQVSTPLLLSLFDPSSPGHDGAVIVDADRVRKFSVHLPLAERFEHYGTLGTRHRAALGLAERSDALVVAVSEERGTISVASGGELRTLAQSGGLKEDISSILKEHFQQNPDRPWHWFLTQNVRDKAIAVLLTLLFWAIFVGSQGSGVITRPYEVPVEFQFLPQGYAVSEMSRETIAVTLSGRNQDFNLLDPEALRMVIRLPGGVGGHQRIRLEESMISRPASLSVVKFTPRYLEFTIQRQE
ncbi:MAG: diadenylate cyclase [Candidatus Entotheonellia bacterium]